MRAFNIKQAIDIKFNSILLKFVYEYVKKKVR